MEEDPPPGNVPFFDSMILMKSVQHYTTRQVCVPDTIWFHPVKNMVDKCGVHVLIDMKDVAAIVTWLTIPPVKKVSFMDRSSKFFSTKLVLSILLFKKLFTYNHYSRVVQDLFYHIGTAFLPIVGCCYPLERKNEYFHVDFESLSAHENILLKNYIWLAIRERCSEPFVYEITPFPILIEHEFGISTLP